MNNYGFLRVAAATPVVKLADPAVNADRIIRLVSKAYKAGVSLIVFPELSMTGYTCGDLFSHDTLLDAAERGIEKIIDFSFDKNIVIVVGVPVRGNDKLLNCAAVICNGMLSGLVPKTAIPTYNEFYESRWFVSGEGKEEIIDYAGEQGVTISSKSLFTIGDWSFCCEICEDLWTAVPPSSFHCMNGALLTVNLSASNEVVGKHDYRKALIAQQSARTISAYIYCSAGYGESTQDLVFGGSSMIYEYGQNMGENERFLMGESMVIADIDCERLSNLRQRTNTWDNSKQIFPEIMTKSWDLDSGYGNWEEMEDIQETDFEKSLYRIIDPHPFVPEGAEADKRCMEILSTQTMGLATRLNAINSKTAVVGVSGGLDSSLALLITALAADKCGWKRDRIIGVTMPGYGTTGRTLANAEELMRSLGITMRNIPITAACDRHFADIGHNPEVKDVTYENAQARERTQILMDIANDTGGIVVGTGDLSELALGWATYNGDHISMYGVNCGVPKTLVRHLVRWAADNMFKKEKPSSGRSVTEILTDILDTPISPELLPAGKDGKIAQKSEDSVGPYELHDFFLYHFFRNSFTPEKILFLACKAFRADTKNPVYDRETIRKWLKVFITRFFSQQFKRSCMPDGPKVGTVSLSPRGDWRMPSDVQPGAFLDF